MITFETYFNTEANTTTVRPLAPVVFLGYQEDADGGFFPLFDLIANISGHPVGSTIGPQTLLKHGFYIPKLPSSIKRGDVLVDDRVTEGRVSKNNPFGYNRIKLKPHKMLPRNTFKHSLPSKPKKHSTFKPRSWKLSIVGTLKKYFEANDPDILYALNDKATITFTLAKDTGFIYTTNVNAAGLPQKVSHTNLRGCINRSTIAVGPNKLKTRFAYYQDNDGTDSAPHYVYFYLLPGKSLTDLKNAITLGGVEGRILGKIFTTWAPQLIFIEDAKGLWEKLANVLQIDPTTLSYNFAETGDLTYNKIYIPPIERDTDREREMEQLRQIHLNAQLKKKMLGVSRDKAADVARKAGIDTKAELNNRKTLGDSVI